MLRRGVALLMVPAHSFIPGGTPSERGYLYRASEINLFHQYECISPAQITSKELLFRTFNRGFVLIFAGLFLLFPVLPNLYRKLSDTMSAGEIAWYGRFGRSLRANTKVRPYDAHMENMSEMEALFKEHSEQIRQLREELGERPEVFDPPRKYRHAKTSG